MPKHPFGTSFSQNVSFIPKKHLSMNFYWICRINNSVTEAVLKKRGTTLTKSKVPTKYEVPKIQVLKKILGLGFNASWPHSPWESHHKLSRTSHSIFFKRKFFPKFSPLLKLLGPLLENNVGLCNLANQNFFPSICLCYISSFCCKMCLQLCKALLCLNDLSLKLINIFPELNDV